MSAWISGEVWIGVEAASLVLVGLGLVFAWLSLRATERQRDEWRRAAHELANCVRIDAWPLGDADERGFATIPYPRSAVVVAPEVEANAWSVAAAKALHRYDTLIEPEGDR